MRPACFRRRSESRLFFEKKSFAIPFICVTRFECPLKAWISLPWLAGSSVYERGPRPRLCSYLSFRRRYWSRKFQGSFLNVGSQGGPKAILLSCATLSRGNTRHDSKTVMQHTETRPLGGLATVLNVLGTIYQKHCGRYMDVHNFQLHREVLWVQKDSRWSPDPQRASRSKH
jgi:hypothetical protein